MPVQGILNTARSLSYYLRQQEISANNLANVNSDAFKADRLTAHQLPGMNYPVPVQTTDLQPGRLRETGRPLDIAIEGDGFLVVQTDHGQRLFRGGSLRLDSIGWLTDLHGDPVLGNKGPILVSGSDVTFHHDGRMMVDGKLAARLSLVTVEDPTTLKKEGSGRFIASTPLIPIPPESTRIRQGAVEEANLDPFLSMIDLVTIQRAYGANVDALKAMDSVLGVVTREVGQIP